MKRRECSCGTELLVEGVVLKHRSTGARELGCGNVNVETQARIFLRLDVVSMQTLLPISPVRG